jgi:NitT/TauT family transport system permease protein
LAEPSVKTVTPETRSSADALRSLGRIAGERLGGRRFARGLTGVLVFLLIGETVSRAGLVDSSYLPPPSTILARAVDLITDLSFLRDIAFTLTGWATGLLIAFVIAVPCGLLLGSLPVVNSAVRMLIEFLRPIPAVALIPLIVLIVADQGQIERILAAYAALWPILLNTIYAVGDVDPVARDMARSFGLGRFKILVRISLPSVAPFIATGARVASSIALIVTISTELVAGGGEHGIGIFMLSASGVSDNADVVFAAVAIAGMLGFLLDLIMRSVERRLFRWHFERLGRPS